MLKSMNIDNFPNKVAPISHVNSDRTTRGMKIGQLQENNTPNTCIGDASRLCNKAPESVQSAKTLGCAKKVQKSFANLTPI